MATNDLAIIQPQAVTLTIEEDDASTDATLNALTVNDGTSDLTLSPGFGSGTYAYAANVGNAVTTVTLSATVNHTGASESHSPFGGSGTASASRSTAMNGG